MNHIHQFNCVTKAGDSIIVLTQTCIIVQTAIANVQFFINFNLHISWLYEKQQLIGLAINFLKIYATQESLYQIKELLDCKVFYLNFSQSYSIVRKLREHKNIEHTIVFHNQERKYYYCKAYNIQNTEFSDVQKEISILNLLKPSLNVVQIKEVYETKYFIIIVTELLYNQLRKDIYFHEEIQQISFQTLKAIEQCFDLKIIHHSIKASKIMFDQQNIVKLVGFSHSKYSVNNIDEEIKIDLISLGKVLLQLYNCCEQKLIEKDFYLPDNGINFIKGLIDKSQYSMSIKMALSHPYFKCLRNETEVSSFKNFETKSNEQFFKQSNEILDQKDSKDISTELFIQIN